MFHDGHLIHQSNIGNLSQNVFKFRLKKHTSSYNKHYTLSIKNILFSVQMFKQLLLSTILKTEYINKKWMKGNKISTLKFYNIIYSKSDVFSFTDTYELVWSCYGLLPGPTTALLLWWKYWDYPPLPYITGTKWCSDALDWGHRWDSCLSTFTSEWTVHGRAVVYKHSCCTDNESREWRVVMSER